MVNSLASPAIKYNQIVFYFLMVIIPVFGGDAHFSSGAVLRVLKRVVG
jgi:hypothetical protein